MKLPSKFKNKTSDYPIPFKTGGNRPIFEPIDFDIPPYFIDYSTTLYSLKLHSHDASDVPFAEDARRTHDIIHTDGMIRHLIDPAR